jgi:hypothetical protein
MNVKLFLKKSAPAVGHFLHDCVGEGNRKAGLKQSQRKLRYLRDGAKNKRLPLRRPCDNGHILQAEDAESMNVGGQAP